MATTTRMAGRARVGCYTTYMLEIEGPEPMDDAVAKALTAQRGDSRWGIDKGEVVFWQSVLSGVQETKWYDHTADMKKVSVQFPDAVLTLYGTGDESGDEWVEYHHRGKVQVERRPEWTAPPFDPAELK